MWMMKYCKSSRYYIGNKLNINYIKNIKTSHRIFLFFLIYSDNSCLTKIIVPSTTQDTNYVARLS